MFSNWGFNIPPVTGSSSPPPPAGEDPDDLENIRQPTTIPKVVVRKGRFTEHIDVDLIEKILAENNGLELQWLKELLVDGVRVLNNTGRYIKSDRFLNRIEKQKKGVTL